LYYPTEISSIIVETSRIDPSPLRRQDFLGTYLVDQGVHVSDRLGVLSFRRWSDLRQYLAS